MSRRTQSSIAMLALAAAIAASTAYPAQAQESGKAPASIAWTLKETGRSLEREAQLTVRYRDGRPVTGGVIVVSLDMPSMPGVHRIAAVRAEATATPGRYLARLQPEMAGDWTAHIEMQAPYRLKVFRKFHVD